jgi:hypothetical protein
MLAGVAAEVVGVAGEESFLAPVREMSRNPTLGGVCQAGRQSLGPGTPEVTGS